MVRSGAAGALCTSVLATGEDVPLPRRRAELGRDVLLRAPDRRGARASHRRCSAPSPRSSPSTAARSSRATRSRAPTAGRRRCTRARSTCSARRASSRRPGSGTAARAAAAQRRARDAQRRPAPEDRATSDVDQRSGGRCRRLHQQRPGVELGVGGGVIIVVVVIATCSKGGDRQRCTCDRGQRLHTHVFGFLSTLPAAPTVPQDGVTQTKSICRA